jgi:type IV pilus assembly protein PilV
MLMSAHASSRRRTQGFTLLEVMAAVLVLSVGLLGLAKMQALAISSTTQSGNRSMISLQATSLAAVIHANRIYWAGGVGCATACTITGGTSATITDSSNILNNPPANCSSACTNSNMAAYDVSIWQQTMYALFPSYSATITCTGIPVTCMIKVSWNEKAVGINQNTAAAASVVNNSAPTPQAFFLYVVP